MKRFFVCVLLLFLAACKPAPTPVLPRVLELHLADPFLHAGVARVDITPPLHLALFGHGPEARIATGVRLRLRCTAFVVAKTPEIVALVPCDLQSPSLALQRAVAARLETIGFGRLLPPERILIMATHTHASPAHYFDAPRYSGAFSSAAPGFDPAVLDFLAQRIAGGIADAFGALEPACAGWNQTAALQLTFNRSYEPFLANRAADPEEEKFLANVTDIASLSSQGDRFDVSSQDPRELAVDPTVSALRFDRRVPASRACKSDVIGAFAVFGMHPTGVENTNELFHGDIFGFATRVAESCLALGAPTTDVRLCEMVPQDWSRAPPVGLANGIEGDVSPKLNMQAFDRARQLGRQLGLILAQTIEGVSNLTADLPLAIRYWELWFPQGAYTRDGKRLCARAELGIASGGGARDGPTRLRIIPEANAGYRLNDEDAKHLCHREKLVLRAGIPSNKLEFPAIGPLSLLEVAGGYLLTTPGEVTTMAGHRLHRAIETRVEKGAPIAIAGLTNAYLQYFATADEYRLQFYEGASTLYGPHSSDFLVRHAGCLADAIKGRPHDCGGQGPMNAHASFTPHPEPVVDRFVESFEDFHAKSPNALEITVGRNFWEATIEALPVAFTSDRSLFSVEIIDGAGNVIDDDRGSAMEIREVVGADKWRIRWFPDVTDHPSPCDERCWKPYRMAIRGRVPLVSTERSIECACAPKP